MTKIRFIDSVNQPVEVQTKEGTSVMRAAVANDVSGIVAECGGEMSCATCHVFVKENGFELFSEPSEDELDLLESTDEFVEGSSRLSCQLIVTKECDGLEVEVANND